jgi:hypothetical protein
MPWNSDDVTLPEKGCIYLLERSSDPQTPPDGVTVIWQGDGTGTGSDGDVLFKRNAGGTVVTNTMLNATGIDLGDINATAAEINMAADNSANVEVVTATNVITAAESGKTFFLATAGGFTSTLPAPAAGLRYKFVISVSPTTAYIIVTNGGDDIMIGGINELEVDTNDDGPYDANADTFNFVANIAVVGDWVEMISDGTSWFYTGQTNADGGVTTSTT